MKHFLRCTISLPLFFAITPLIVITPIIVMTPALGQTLDRNAYRDAYYASVKVFHAKQKALSMATSSRPSIGQFVALNDNVSFYNGSVALGYRFGDGWRAEGEYSFMKNTLYTSGSSNFPASLNFQEVKTQRLMLNVYRDWYLANRFSVNGSLGLGVARIETGGYQGNESRTFAYNTESNLTYSIGVGASYALTEHLNFDLGYRYVDMGKIESGYNEFTNVRRLQDEQLKARIVSNEIFLGARYSF